MKLKLSFFAFAICANAVVMAGVEEDWQCLTNAISTSFDLNPSNRTDMQQISYCGKCFSMMDAAATELVSTNKEALFFCLDDIGAYIPFPTNVYMIEVANARAEYAEWQSNNPPTQALGVVHSLGDENIEGAGRFGNVVYERWEPVISRNKQIEAYRRKILLAFRPAIQRHLHALPVEMRAVFQTNVVMRASLSTQEAELIFPE